MADKISFDKINSSSLSPTVYSRTEGTVCVSSSMPSELTSSPVTGLVVVVVGSVLLVVVVVGSVMIVVVVGVVGLVVGDVGGFVVGIIVVVVGVVGSVGGDVGGFVIGIVVVVVGVVGSVLQGRI